LLTRILPCRARAALFSRSLVGQADRPRGSIVISAVACGTPFGVRPRLRRAMAHRMPAPPQARATFLPARFLPQNGCSMLNSGTPRAILDDLVMRGCAAPRALAVDHFVVRGQFLERGRNDWAVLCIGHDRSSILVFERNHRRPFAELDPRPEDDQRMPRLARFILPMGPSKIRDISVDRTARESASGMTG
jgi:hypothetical protein